MNMAKQANNKTLSKDKSTVDYEKMSKELTQAKSKIEKLSKLEDTIKKNDETIKILKDENGDMKSRIKDLNSKNGELLKLVQEKSKVVTKKYESKIVKSHKFIDKDGMIMVTTKPVSYLGSGEPIWRCGSRGQGTPIYREYKESDILKMRIS